MVAILAHPIAALVFGFIGLVVLGMIIPNPFRDKLRLLIGIKINKALAVDPIDEEMALIDKEAKIVADGQRKASELKGTLNNEKNKLSQLETDVTSATNDYNLAAQMKDAGQAGADEMVASQLANVGAKEAERDAQKSVVADIQATVDATYSAVSQAKSKLSELQRTAKSHQARAKATQVNDSAAAVLESYKGMNSVGAKINAAGDKVNEKFEQSKARLDDAKGTPAEQAFEAAKAAQGNSSLQARLEAARKGTTAPAAAPSTTTTQQ
jgi:chromosome segregation ATPase